MYECGKLKKVIGNKFLFPVILEQCGEGVKMNYISKFFYSIFKNIVAIINGEIFSISVFSI